MATRFIHQGIGVPDAVANAAGFAVDEDGVLGINRGPEYKGSLSADPGTEHIPVKRVIAVTADTTLTPADSGALVIIDTTTATTVTLPATEKGLTYSIHLAQLAASGAHAIDVNAADKFLYDGKADGATLVFTNSADAIGDGITVVGDGDDGWYVTAVVEATPDNIT